jgi:hypothetical protein
MAARRWVDPPPVAVSAALRAAVGGHPLIAETLARRGFADPAAARAFLDPAAYVPPPASELPDLDAAVEVVARALRAGERIAVWGDFDVDGQTAAALLVEGLRALGGDVIDHIPLREPDGHGVHIPQVGRLIDAGARLILTCDTGIAAHAAIAYAVERGVTVVVTDHHNLPDVLPTGAAALVDPKRLADPAHPLRTLPGVGVAHLFLGALAETLGRSVPENRDLVALGIVAGLIRSELELPEPVLKLLAIYLLFSIGLKGGVELGAVSFAEIAGLLAVALALTVGIPLAAFVALRRLGGFDAANAAAVAAHYGSVSSVTFFAAIAFANAMATPSEGYMTAVVAIMEWGVIVALMLARWSLGREAGNASVRSLVLDTLRGRGILLLSGGMLIGLLSGERGWKQIASLPAPVLSIAASPAFHCGGPVLAGTEGAGLWRSDDGGYTFRPVPDAPEVVNALLALPNGWLLSDVERIWRSEDGARWTPLASPPALTFLRTRQGRVLAGGMEGVFEIE